MATIKHNSPTTRAVFRTSFFVLVMSTLMLSGCDLLNVGGESINQWYQNTTGKYKNRNTNRVIVPVKPFSIVSFEGNKRDPFDARNLIQVIVKQEDVGKDRFAPNFERLREPLETYAISSISFVGTILQKSPEPNIALVNAAGSLYQVKVGNYLGQDYGLVQEIRDTEIVINETIKDETGRWVQKEHIINLAGLSKEKLR